MSAGNVSAGWKKFSIYNPANGDVVQVNTVDPEYTNYEEAIIGQESTETTRQVDSIKTISLGGFDFDGFATVQQWKKDGTLLNAVAYSPNGANLQMYEDLPIESLLLDYKPNRRNGLNRWGVQFVDVGGANTHTNVNLLAYNGWADGDGDGLADGYSSSYATNTFASDEQTLENTTGIGAFNRIVNFPITGVSLTISHNKTSPGSQSGEFVLRDFSNTSLLTETIAQTTSGVQSRTIESVSNTYRLQCNFFKTSGAVLAKTKFPALTTNGQLTPGDSFLDW